MECDVKENKRSHRVCELCSRVIIGDREWAGRACGARHSGAARRERREAASLAGAAWPGDPQHTILGFQGLLTARV